MSIIIHGIFYTNFEKVVAFIRPVTHLYFGHMWLFPITGAKKEGIFRFYSSTPIMEEIMAWHFCAIHRLPTNQTLFEHLFLLFTRLSLIIIISQKL